MDHDQRAADRGWWHRRGLLGHYRAEATRGQARRQVPALEALSSKLAKYLAPQVYNSIFTGQQDVRITSKRKKLTVCFSDIADFTEITDKMESEDLTSSSTTI